jgi:hypothetical protein
VSKTIVKRCQACAIILLALLLNACGGGSSIEPITPPPPPLGVTSVSLGAAGADLTAGEEVMVTVTMTRALDTTGTLELAVERAEETQPLLERTVNLSAGQRSFTVPVVLPLFTENGTNTGYDVVAQLKVSAQYQTSRAESELFWVAATAPADVLLNSNGEKWANAEQAGLLVEQGLLDVVNTSYAPWPLPSQPTWQENPYDNNTWLLYYHALGWLYGFDFAYEQQQDETLLDQAQAYLLSYIEQVSRDGANNNYMAWDDHAVAWRLETLTYFYQKYFRNTLTEAQKQRYVNAMLDHADELVDYFSQARFYGHNHSMYHALALYNMTYVIPVESDARNYRGQALQRINELFSEMVAADSGASVEQSTSYHFIAMELFNSANQLITTMTGEPLAELNEDLTRMADFATHLIYRNGGATALGNTNYGHTQWWERLQRISEQGAIASDYMRYLASAGGEGCALEQSYVAWQEGYAIQRPDYSYAGDEMFTMTDFGKKLVSHGHHDAGNVIAVFNGEQLLIDSGGPYRYDSPKRRYYAAATAHNTLVVDGVTAFSNDAELLLADCEHGLCYSVGKITESHYQHWRLVFSQVTVHGPRWTIVDIAKPNAVNKLTDYKLIYHFALDAGVTVADEAVECQHIQLGAEQDYCLQVASPQDLQVHKFEGHEADGYTQGWVTTAFAERAPAPVIEFRTATTTTFSAVTELRSLLGASEPLAQLEETSGTTGTYQLQLGAYSVTIVGLESSSPVLQVGSN